MSKPKNTEVGKKNSERHSHRADIVDSACRDHSLQSDIKYSVLPVALKRTPSSVLMQTAAI